MKLLTLLILISLASTSIYAAEPLSIEDKPIQFTEKRIALTRQYRKQHYGIDQNDITIIPKLIVVHWTELENLQQSFHSFDPEILPAFRTEIKSASALNVSIHFLVDRDGTIYRLMPETWMARHVIGLNNNAIGIENVGGVDSKDDLTLEQLHSNVALIRYLQKKYPTITNIIGHDEYQQFENTPLWLERDKTYRTDKTDPGKRFMRALRQQLV